MLKTFSITDIGKKRKVNQDYVYSSDTAVGSLPDLFVVADGMGGHNGGDFASRFAADCIVDYAQNCEETDPKSILKNAITLANTRLREKASEDKRLEGMGTTVVAATISENQLLVANVGDSRLYIINDKIKQITKDHSLVEEMVRAGGIDKETARRRSDKNIITRAVGATDEIDIDFFKVPLKKGDTVLMCSDGLTNMLEDYEIISIIEGQRDIVEKAQKLVEAANNNGGNDNIAVILVET